MHSTLFRTNTDMHSPFVPTPIGGNSLCDLKIHHYTGHNAPTQRQEVEEVSSVLCKYEALGASHGGEIDDHR